MSSVIIVGGGVVGCACAYFLTRAGLSVTLLERDDLATHASGAAAGMIVPLCESEGEGAFFEFGLRSLELIPNLTAELRELSGIDPQWVPSGVLRIALSEADAAHLQARLPALSGYGVEWLSREVAREREPRISAKIIGALWSPREGHVYSPMFARAYAQAAARLGAKLRCRTPVTGLLRDGDRVIGVCTAEGEVRADHVVLSGGAWTRFLGEWLGLTVPISPVRGQILALASPAPPLRTIVWSENAYLVPKLNGSIVVGATEEDAGFDCRTTGAGIAGLLTAAAEAIPELADATFLEAWAGLRPDTPDHFPLIGPVPGVEGVTLAAGHFRNGVLLSPITGELVTAYVTSQPTSNAAAAFLPERLLA